MNFFIENQERTSLNVLKSREPYLTSKIKIMGERQQIKETLSLGQ